MTTRVHPYPLLEPGQRLNIFQRAARWVARRYAAIRPSRTLLRGAAYAVEALTILLMGVTFTYVTTPYGAAVNFIIGCVVGLAMLGAGDLVRHLLTFIVKVFPRPLLTALFGLTLVILNIPQNLPPLALVAAIALLFASVGIVGGFVYRIARGGFPDMPLIQRIATIAIYLIAAGFLVYAGMWLAQTGVSNDLPAYAPPPMTGVESLKIENPGLPGRYTVQMLTYGSGTDKRRPEFGSDVGLQTPTVNASPLLPNWTGWTGTIYWEFWGFNTDALPLNGRVWYPQGTGPFPIVMIVHGNHAMEDFSDEGYAYLAEHLASRGFIAVSVDENFLNGSSVPFANGVTGEQDVRGWLLLKHLEQFRAWNRDRDNPLYGLVDLDRVALIGHSRGGEAALTAAALNDLRYFPDNASVQMNFDFGVRAVVAIAPADGQYWPAGRRTPLENVNYLTLQGSYDGDMAWYEGIRAYQRVEFNDGAYHFKAGLYIDGANHGQFNTTWGRVDNPSPVSWFMNFDPIMDAAAQRQIALTYIGGFLEASLHDQLAYVPMFRDSRTALDWLPPTGYVNRFEDSTFRMLADFEHDIDLTTPMVAGGLLRGVNLVIWNETNAPMRRDWEENRVVNLGWNTPEGGAPASFSLDLPHTRALIIHPAQSLAFSISDVGQIPEQPGALEAGDSTYTLDFMIMLTEADGSAVALPLSDFAYVPPPFHTQFVKSGFFDVKGFGVNSTSAEMQTVYVPLARFVEANPNFNLADLRTITFVFNRIPAGIIEIGEIGLAE